MRFTLPPTAFPALELAANEQAVLIDEANRVLDETIRVNEAFLAAGRRFARDEWKPVRSKDGVSVYKQRAAAALKKGRAASSDSARAADHASSATSPSSEPATANVIPNASATSYVEWIKRPQVPLLALSGVLDGTLDDTMFGCFADTDESWRSRSTYVKEHFDDARILFKVLGPTPAEPYRFLGVKWFIKEHPAALSQFIKRRDFVIVEATGITEDSEGRRVGYLLMHSMAIPRIPELRDLGVVRANVSFCFLIRQHATDDSRVDIYCRGFTDPMGDMLESVSVRLTAESLISSVSVVDYAYVKKLKQLMLTRRQQQLEPSPAARRPSSRSRCESCDRALNKFSLLQAVTSSSTGAACHLCWKVICGRCSVAKKMIMDIVDNEATQKVFHFCVGCVLEAKNTSALGLAMASVPPPPPTRSGSRRRPPSQSKSQLRKERSASSQSTASSTSSHVSERQPQKALPLAPTRQPPPPPPPVAHSHKVPVAHSTTFVR